MNLMRKLEKKITKFCFRIIIRSLKSAENAENAQKNAENLLNHRANMAARSILVPPVHRGLAGVRVQGAQALVARPSSLIANSYCALHPVRTWLSRETGHAERSHRLTSFSFFVPSMIFSCNAYSEYY